MKTKTFTFFLLLCSLLFFMEESTAQCHVDDYTALRALYLATDGDNWADNTGWDVSSATPPPGCDVCSYSGVSCIDGRVTELVMTYNQLNGPLPSEIGYLENLENLDLGSNNLIGPIPSEIESLSNLTRLILNNCRLTGSIPVEIGNLTSLTDLNLALNRLSGTIPVELGNLTNLTGHLFLQSNQLMGTIPAEFGNLTNLEWVELGENQLNGAIPKELGSMTSLQILRLEKNQLAGTLPKELGDLSSFIILNASNNQLTGLIPVEFGDLASMISLNLSNNQLSGCIPSSLMSLCGVSVNLLGNLGLEEENFSSFCTSNSGECSEEPCHPDYPALMALYNATNGANWTDNTNWAVNCDVCAWNGVLCINNRVAALFLNDNQLNGNIPPEFGQLAELIDLDLRGNSLTGSIPPEIGQLTNLRSISLYNNSISGSIPSEIGNLTNLGSLKLDFNDLTGTIPTQIGSLSNLWFLDLSHNDLTGSIPATLGNLNNLITLDLTSNMYSGEIPIELGNLSELRVLLLGDNTLQGNIPEELGSLQLGQNLSSVNIGLFTDTYLDLTTNQLSGCIPSSLMSLCGVSINLLGNSGLEEENFSSFCTSNSGECTDEPCHPDYPALMALYNATDGANWTNNTNWEEDCDVCNWYGITCENNRVTKIELGLNNLQGPIPPAIGNLTELTVLNLQLNELTGTIPIEVTSLVNLIELQLNGDQLSGSIPPEIGNLTELTLLSLGFNLSGSIPSEIGDLAKLKFLDLGFNQLTGAIPPEIGRLIDLEQLSLISNQLTGSIPSEIGNLTKLWNLDLGFNQFSGRIPLTFKNLEALGGLYLNVNQLSGNILSDLGNLPSLNILDLSYNLFTGCIPSELNSLCGNNNIVNLNNNPNLSEQDFMEFCNSNSGICIPACHPDSLALMALYNSTNGPYWTNNTNWGTNCEVCTWEGITCNDAGRVSKITLPNNNLRGYLPSELGQLTALEELFLDGNNLYGIIPEDLYYIPLLENIILSNNSLEGALSSSICQLSNLNEIRLANNYLSGEIPSCLDAFTNLSVIDLQNNLFYGCYPNNWINYCGNDQMNFEGNSCLRIWAEFCDTNGDCNGNVYFSHSAIPALMLLYDATDGPNWANNTDWGNTCDPCTWHGVECNSNGKVSGLHLDNNNLSGELPAEIGLLTDLRVLRLGNNQLSGNIPIEIGGLVNMFWIELYNNNFSGTFPDIFDAWNQLHDIRISSNDFEGPLPYSLGFKTTLRVAEFYNNNFSGCFPFSYKNLCTNKATIFQSGFGFGGNPQLPNGGDFDAFCSSEAGMCEEQIGCDWVALEVHTGTQELDLFYHFISLNENLNFNSSITGSYNFGTNSPNATLEYLFPLPSGTNDFFIANWAGNDIEYFQLRNLETGEVLVDNQSYYSNIFTICSTIEECPEEIVNDLDFISGTSTVRAKDIYASHVIHSGSNLTYKAETSITLQADFEVQEGATFLATIEDCPLPVQTITEPKLERLITSIANDNMTIYPNPFTDQTTISYSLSKEQQISLFIVDILGKPIKNLMNNKWITAGTHQLIFQRETLPKGTYFVILKNEEGYESQKLLLLD